MGSYSPFSDVVSCPEGVQSCDIAPGSQSNAGSYHISTSNPDIANTAATDPAFDVVGAAVLAVILLILAMCLKWRPSAWISR